MEEIDSLLSDATRAYHSGNFHNAEALVRRSLVANDRSAIAWHLLSQLAERAGQLDDALVHARKAVSIEATVASLHSGLADIHQSRGELTFAISSYQRALECDSRYAPALNNLAAVYKSLGDLPRAIEVVRRALDAAPDLPAIRSNLLTMLLYDQRISGEQLVEEHRQLAQEWETTFSSNRHMTEPRLDRRIRIGYVSPDFCEHAVMRFFEPVLAAHDRQRFEIYLYSECPIVDAVGQRLRSFGDQWCVTWLRSSRDVAARIAEDRIDILIDLAGHTRHNRLDVLALRPAPIQATYLGYPSVTGLRSIDYRLTDKVLDPPGSRFVENLERLERGYACLKGPTDAPIVAPNPSLRNGFVTFGSHHPLLKLNSSTFLAWRKILEQSPRSRLLLFRSEFEGDIRQRLEEYIDEYRLPRERVEIRAVAKQSSNYLKSYDDIDIILDAFPFNGHTMTCEALWMGVPVLTIRGDRPAGRLSTSVLTALELQEFIATSVDDYVDRAIAIARSPDRLIQLRSQLRKEMVDKLGGTTWTKGLERTYRRWWEKWCEQQTSSSTKAPRPSRFCREDLSSVALDSPSDDFIDEGDALLRQGERFQREGRFDDALQCFLEIDRREPWNPENPFRIGNLYAGANRCDDALRQYRKAIGVAPDFFAAWAMMGQTYGNQGFIEEAERCYRNAIRIRPDPKAFVTLATLLPQIYSSTEELNQKRREVENRIHEQLANGVVVDPTQGPIPNFFLLAYQGGNARQIQEMFARTISPPSLARRMRIPLPAHDGRIRIGFISEYFCNHTIGTLNRGFVDHLDRKKFHLTVLSAASQRDETYQHYQNRSDRFISLTQNISDAVRILQDLELDVIFFADIGMSCFTLSLAALRFAPVQCVTWGHPITTGLPTIDYFLSGSIYESENAQDHYSETLVKLPGLQTCYPRPDAITGKRRQNNRGLPETAHWYGCPQTLFKFHPEFDPLIAGILRQDRSGILVLLAGAQRHWQEMLLDRWRRTMSDVVDRIHFLPPLSRPEFLSLCRDCDVLLDPIHFGGGNTTLEGLAMTTPVVTWPTEYLKARLAQGMLRHAGLEFLVKTSAEEYVAEAVMLGCDSDYNQDVRSKIAEQSGELFEHMGSIRAFEEFFVEATESARSRRHI